MLKHKIGRDGPSLEGYQRETTAHEKKYQEDKTLHLQLKDSDQPCSYLRRASSERKYRKHRSEKIYVLVRSRAFCALCS